MGMRKDGVCLNKRRAGSERRKKNAISTTITHNKTASIKTHLPQFCDIFRASFLLLTC